MAKLHLNLFLHCINTLLRLKKNIQTTIQFLRINNYNKFLTNNTNRKQQFGYGVYTKRLGKNNEPI